jgi:nucleoside-diphosphate-sugar epimerase
VRIVSRNPEKVVPSNETFAADLLIPEAVNAAVAGSDVVYLLVGFPYKAKVWEALWPVVMQNTIEACRVHGSTLVFFDNVYMYDRDRLSPMDENTPFRPTSRKGQVRADIANRLLDEIRKGNIEALIARCADFYGPGRQQNSVLTQTVFERLAAGKSGQWLLSADCVHSFTYTPDAARATAMLGNSPDAYGETWHLPTASGPPTGRQWIERIAAELGVEANIQVMGRSLLAALSLVSPILREIREMAYQYDRDYDFNSDKFEQRFGFNATGYDQGIRAVVETDYR